MQTRRRVAAVLLLALVCVTAPPAAQEPSPAQGEAAQPTFRAGVNVVRVDVIVTDRSGKPVTNLTRDDFEILEDGKPQAIEQFRLIDTVAGGGDPLPAQELRTRDDELVDAGREDVRVFAFFLDEYHVPKLRSAAVRDMAVDFIRTHVRPNDLLALVYPLTSVRTLTFTRDHDAVILALRQFEGRRGEYFPRNPIEEQHYRNLPAIGRIRAEVVLNALSALSVRLGSLREGRKSLVFVSEGFGAGGAGELQMRDAVRDANRHNVSIYPVDPCGLSAPGGFSSSGLPDCRASRARRDLLLYLAEETDGRAVVNRNTLAEGLAQVARDSASHYLLGYTSTQQASDGRFHPIRVRVKARDLDVRARKGYWALTAADLTRLTDPTPAEVTPVQRALAAIDLAEGARRYVRTWIGSERGSDGRARVTVSWELQPARDRQRWEEPGQLLVTVGGDGQPVSVSERGPVAATPNRVVFDSPPGTLDVRLAVESVENGETIDRQIIAVDVPDFSTNAVALSTPRVYAPRTAAALRATVADGAAVPIARREFARSERLLIRFDAYGGGDAVGAALLNSNGDRMTELPLSPAQAGGTHQISFALGSLAPGSYVIEVSAKGPAGVARELVPLRVGS
jgi:VWFA-related protein